MPKEPAEEAPGGFVSGAGRVGHTVRRPPPPDPRFVRRLLHHFEQWAWPGAPRYLGVDERGREILSYLPGTVPWDRPVTGEPVAGQAALVRLAERPRLTGRPGRPARPRTPG
ncbi:hypothetical protein [Rhizomonospora bruguierae]|uniref:hypothetical protein n=1 Tax=Rhizomonospora bruguierae TaxID=1581705 RepID=UPI001BCD4AAA|nr:hypothetical protein [Micromonospora sp. NBRC 107566]